jgi:hypothetical protein
MVPVVTGESAAACAYGPAVWSSLYCRISRWCRPPTSPVATGASVPHPLAHQPLLVNSIQQIVDEEGKESRGQLTGQQSQINGSASSSGPCALAGWGHVAHATGLGRTRAEASGWPHYPPCRTPGRQPLSGGEEMEEI